MDSPFQDPLTHFGLDFIDAETGGLIRDKLYLLHGPASPWKTAIALHFIHEGLRNDQRGVYITSQDPDAVLLQAERFGINLRHYVRSERLVLLTYHPRISQHLESRNGFGPVLAELTALVGPERVDRIVFDPVVPLIEQTNRAAILPATRLLIEGLQSLEATILCIVDDTDEPHTHVILKEFTFLSFGVFLLAEEEDGSRVFHFRKVIWNPKSYPQRVLALRSRYGVQTLEPQEPPKTRLVLADEEETPDPIPLDRPWRILLVDDDDTYHETLGQVLGRGYQVEWVRDSVEALSRLLEHAYDVVLANMSMPRVDGRELALRIRRHNNTVPVILYSGTHKRGVDGAEALRVGADMFLTRPLAFNYVKTAIDAVLRRSAATDRFAQTLKYIAVREAETRALQSIPRQDPETGLATRAYFEAGVHYAIEKASLVSSVFAIAGYHIRPVGVSPGLENVIREALREQFRQEDLVIRVKPHVYLAFLDECLLPERVSERLLVAIRGAVGANTFVFQSAAAFYPSDGRDHDTLVRVVMGKLGAGTPKLKRLS